MTPSQFASVVSMLQRIKANYGSEEHRRSVQLLAMDHSFSTAQVYELLQTFRERSAREHIMAHLFVHISDIESAHDMMKSLFSDAEMASIRENLGRLFYFHPQWPNGHYEFDLGEKEHKYLAKRVFYLACWEREAVIGADLYKYLNIYRIFTT